MSFIHKFIFLSSIWLVSLSPAYALEYIYWYMILDKYYYFSDPKLGCDWYYENHSAFKEHRNSAYDELRNGSKWNNKYLCGYSATDYLGRPYHNTLGGLSDDYVTCKDNERFDPATFKCVESDNKCPSGFNRNPQTGQCETIQTKKNTGTGDCSQPETTKSTGNPIRVSTGNKFQVETDITGPLPFTRYYNSELKGWSHQYQYQIQQPRDNPKLIYLIRPDGKILPAKQENGQWQTDSDVFLTIFRTTETPSGWLVKTGKQQETYDDQGRLTSLEKTNGNTLTSEWTENQQIIKDAKGNQLTISYGHDYFLSSVRINEHDPVTYTYGPFLRLTMVNYPNRKGLLYHYENGQFPLHLTGITDENGVRFATWTYDNQGRAISSEHAGGKEKVSLEFHDNNATTVT
ncbi:RHS repeat protein, partial [Endozoicomonas sp. SM1973]